MKTENTYALSATNKFLYKAKVVLFKDTFVFIYRHTVPLS